MKPAVHIDHLSGAERQQIPGNRRDCAADIFGHAPPLDRRHIFLLYELLVSNILQQSTGQANGKGRRLNIDVPADSVVLSDAELITLVIQKVEVVVFTADYDIHQSRLEKFGVSKVCHKAFTSFDTLLQDVNACVECHPGTEPPKPPGIYPAN